VNVAERWTEILGSPLFRGSMNQTIEFLAMCLIFDDKSTRSAHKTLDRFAAISEIWEMFIGN
jgi:hypothetical protein